MPSGTGKLVRMSATKSESKTGRPTSFNDLAAKRILDAVRRGCSQLVAAQAAGISRSTLQSWLAKGRDGEQPFSDFLDRLEGGAAEAELTISDVVFEAAKTDPRIALEWLARRRPESWAAKRAPTEEVEENKVIQLVWPTRAPSTSSASED